MAKKYSSLLWDTHANYLSNGLTQLQQNEEFVDMTLGVEGYFVKVHKSVIALSSPYLKEVIKSLNCPHPVIFLHNISKDILGYLLEYIYLGEAVVPNDQLGIFIKKAKELHIAGIEAKYLSMINFQLNDENIAERLIGSQTTRSCPTSDEQITIENQYTTSDASRASNDVRNLPIILSSEIIKSADYSQPNNVDIIDNDHNYGDMVEPPLACSQHQDEPDLTNIQNEEPNEPINEILNSNQIDMENMIPENVISNDYVTKDENREDLASASSEIPRNIVIPLEGDADSGARSIVISTDVPADPKSSEPVNTGQQYTVSNQGSMQMILNRYIYCVHYKSGNRGVKRRWRCMDYRRKGCKAYLDTIGENISDRVNAHTHPFHDNAILMKVRKGLVFTSIDHAEENSTRRHLMNEPCYYDVEDENFTSKKSSTRKRKRNN